jgi:hypothetical protein
VGLISGFHVVQCPTAQTRAAICAAVSRLGPMIVWSRSWVFDIGGFPAVSRIPL